WGPSLEIAIDRRGALRAPAFAHHDLFGEFARERSAGARSAPLHESLELRLRWAWAPSVIFSRSPQPARPAPPRRHRAARCILRWAWGPSFIFGIGRRCPGRNA